MNKNQAIWIAGVMEAIGRFENPTIVSNKIRGEGRLKGCRFTLSSTKHELVKEFAKVTGWKVSASGSKALKTSCSGEELHSFMKQVWPWLSAHRKKAYQKAYVTARES